MLYIQWRKCLPGLYVWPKVRSLLWIYDGFSYWKMRWSLGYVNAKCWQHPNCRMSWHDVASTTIVSSPVITRIIKKQEDSDNMWYSNNYSVSPVVSSVLHHQKEHTRSFLALCHTWELLQINPSVLFGRLWHWSPNGGIWCSYTGLSGEVLSLLSDGSWTLEYPFFGHQSWKLQITCTPG